MYRPILELKCYFKDNLQLQIVPYTAYSMTVAQPGSLIGGSWAGDFLLTKIETFWTVLSQNTVMLPSFRTAGYNKHRVYYCDNVVEEGLPQDVCRILKHFVFYQHVELAHSSSQTIQRSPLSTIFG